MVFDGDCGFCRFWVHRWRETTGDLVDYATSQEVGDQFPTIPREEFEQAVQLIRPDGMVVSGADAIFEALGYVRRRWRWLSRLMKIGVFRAAARGIYRLVARHRGFFSSLNRMLFGAAVGRPGYGVARWVFVRALGLIYLIAFASLAVQILGLIGRRGILPAGEYLDLVRQNVGTERYWRLPTIFWINASDPSLLGACIAGMIASALVAAGVFPTVGLVLCWILYISLSSVSQRFLGYQWDVLLVEAGFLTIFLAATQKSRSDETFTSRLTRWLLLWLLFRLMFESGVVKLASGDPAWRNLTALDYHYETQPLPTWIAWYANASPMWVHKASVAIMFAIELGAPFLIFGPRMARRLSCAAMGGLQVLIAGTGNYGFFNLLALALGLLLLDDAAWPAWLRRRALPERNGKDPFWVPWALAPVAALHLTFGAVQLRGVFDRSREWPQPMMSLYRATAPFRLVNSYGLFAVMTKTRPEIIIEGSADGIDWKPYEFKWKPGDVNRRPRFVAPHQPRLDWQMWFAALDVWQRNEWLLRFMARVMEGSPEVLGLLGDNPFPDQPPKYMRAILYDYQFTKPGEGKPWWKRRMLREYAPELQRQ